MNYRNYVKSQLTNSDFKVVNFLPVNLNTKILANLWPDFVDYKKRSTKEIKFILSQIKDIKNPKIFDSTLGSGATSIGLKKTGKDVISNEVDSYYIRIAKEEARKQKVTLDIRSFDWRELDTKLDDKFDVVLCLGNSLTYLFKKEDQLKTLNNLRNILKHKGKLIIDERNYPSIINNHYKHSKKYIYCGEKVDAKPIYVSNTMVIMEYSKGKQKAHLVLYPFREDELYNLLKDTGFKKIKRYYDYKEKKDKDCEFITYVAEK